MACQRAGSFVLPHVKAVVARAVEVSAEGVGAPRPGRGMLAEHRDQNTEHDGRPYLPAEAEECIRGAGLRPWLEQPHGRRSAWMRTGPEPVGWARGSG